MQQTQEDIPDRLPLCEEFRLIAEGLLRDISVVRDGRGHAVDPNSIEADPERFEQRRRLAWELLLVAYCKLLDEDGLDRHRLGIDDRLLYDAIRGLRTAAVFHDWHLQVLNPPVQRNALREMIEMSRSKQPYEGVSFRLWLERGTLCFDDSLLDLLCHLVSMLTRGRGHDDDDR